MVLTTSVKKLAILSNSSVQRSVISTVFTTKTQKTTDFISSKPHSKTPSPNFFQAFLSLPKFCSLALLASTCHLQVHADNINNTVVLPKTKDESLVAGGEQQSKELRASKVVGYVDWSNYSMLV